MTDAILVLLTVVIFLSAYAMLNQLRRIAALLDSIDGYMDSIAKNTTAPPSDWHGL